MIQYFVIAKVVNERTIHVFDKTQFDINQIRTSGQIFVDPPCTITEFDDRLEITATDGVTAEYLFNFFDLGTDYNEIKSELGKLPVLHDVIKHGGGIRILRQSFVPCVISFIVSANNNIKRFTKTIEQIDFENLGKYTEFDFQKMGAGYRAPYLVRAIEQLQTMGTEESKARLRQMSAETLVETLMTLPGVGKKVASCIALFSDILPNSKRFTVCPIDVHIKRAFEQLGIEQTDVILNHKYAGVAQQYIFYYVQHLKNVFKGE